MIDVAAANADREITRYEAIASEIQIGTQTVPNPEYATAQSQVVQAQTALQNMQIQKLQIDAEYCTGWACLAKAVAQIAAAAQIDEAQGALSTAMSALHTTPLTRELPIYGSYEFKRAEIVATKTAVANYFVIDRVGKRMFKGSFDLVERREFAVPYGIDQNDRYLYRHLSKFDEEDDVVDFEQEALTVSVDTLIARYMVDPGQTRTVASVAALRKAVVNDRKAVLARFDATPVRAASAGKYDDLANSVVAIVSPNGALGTGFYVADKFVVTNLHVVGDNRLLEIRRKDGEETFGKVIASDVRRDLALIKVDAAGPPVDFLASSDVPVGETVVAIGHPRGLEFSVSQGIVSAVRKTASHAVGGKPVWHIQTDAAMNPGNSGGPLFLGNRVAGVITWARREETDTGLGFAVHYSEVLDFLASQELAPLVRGPAPIPATKPPGGVIDVSVPAAAAND